VKTHEDAIAELERREFRDVSRRKWTLGDCVVVPLGHSDTHGDIAAYPDVAWLVPSDDGWDLVRTFRQKEWRRRFTSLDLAFAALLDVASRFAFPDRCSHCRAEVDGHISENLQGDLRYRCSIRCPKCGNQVESDGVGEMPDAWRECLIAREGRWNVTITASATIETWKRVHQILRLDLRDLAELRRTPNARVYSGTFGMATWVAREIGEAAVELDES